MCNIWKNPSLPDEEISLETYIYLSLLTELPQSDDMITQSVNGLVDRYRDWFLYFTDSSMEDHEKSARSLLQKIREDL